MSMVRAFIALEIPPEVQASIKEHTALLRNKMPELVRWVDAAKIHLTLKFLGDTSPANLQNLSSALTATLAQQPSFQISIGEFGVFPNLKRPRVLWIGVQAPPELEQLQRAIESTCHRLGYPPEEKPFNPHLTIGRLRDGADLTSLRPIIEATKIGQIGQITIQSVTLMRSDLRPQGPIYTPLAAMPLHS